MSDYVEDLAATMLASTLGIEFNPDAAWDERKRVYAMSDLIVDSLSITAAAEGASNRDWTCAVAAAVFRFYDAAGTAVSGPPTYAVAPSFLGVEHRDRAAAFCIAGIPHDIGTTNRSGARFGPAAIRTASRMLVDGAHPEHWVDPAALPLADIGDFATALGDIPASLG